MNKIKYLLMIGISVIGMMLTGCSDDDYEVVQHVYNEYETSDINEDSRAIVDDTLIAENIDEIESNKYYDIGGYVLEDYIGLLDNLSIHSAGGMYTVHSIGQENYRKYYIPIAIDTYEYDSDMLDNLKFSVNINQSIYKETKVDNIGPIKLLYFEYENIEIKDIKILIGLNDNYNKDYKITHEYIIKSLDVDLMKLTPQGILNNRAVTKLSDSAYVYTEYTIAETDIVIKENLFKQYQVIISFNGWGPELNSFLNNDNIDCSFLDKDGVKINLGNIEDVNSDSFEIAYDKVYMHGEYIDGSYISLNLICPVKDDSIESMEHSRETIQRLLFDNLLKIKIKDSDYLLNLNYYE